MMAIESELKALKEYHDALQENHQLMREGKPPKHSMIELFETVRKTIGGHDVQVD